MPPYRLHHFSFSLSFPFNACQYGTHQFIQLAAAAFSYFFGGGAPYSLPGTRFAEDGSGKGVFVGTVVKPVDPLPALAVGELEAVAGDDSTPLVLMLLSGVDV
jgi:hypothetical protein